MKLTCAKCGKVYDTDQYETAHDHMTAEHSYTGGEDDGCVSIWFKCDCGYEDSIGCVPT